MRNHLMGVTKTKQAHPEDAPKENLGQLHVFETSVPLSSDTNQMKTIFIYDYNQSYFCQEAQDRNTKVKKRASWDSAHRGT